MKVVVIIEKGADNNWGAYTPDMPVAVVGASETEAAELIREAIDLYIADLREKGLPMPIPASALREIEISA